LDLDRIADDWHARGFSCAMWVDPPGQQWEDFVHGVDELVMVVEGEMEFEVEGEIVSSEIGEELFIPAGAVHSTRNIGGTVSRWLYGYRDRKVD
jgi:mannose-6-phosphate isomerase-like protein (cupin superfamily)